MKSTRLEASSSPQHAFLQWLANHSPSWPSQPALAPPSLTTPEFALTWSCVFENEVFIIKLLSIDGLASCAIVVCEITALAHELGDDAVEAASLEAKALFMGAQATEIL